MESDYFLLQKQGNNKQNKRKRGIRERKKLKTEGQGRGDSSNVCSKRASCRASTTGRVCFKDVFGTLSEGLRPSVNMQWNLYEVLLCAQIFFMCCVRIRLYRPIPIPTYNLNLFPSSLDMTYRMVTNFTLCPKKNE